MLAVVDTGHRMTGRESRIWWRKYGDFPLGGADASIVALAERLDIKAIITLDDRHFRAVRPRHREAFRLLP